VNSGPIVIAHRGASAVEAENTVAAFRRARELGADWVELDVHLSRDGVLVVHHDDSYADGRALPAVASADRPPSVPTLAEALAACDGMGVNVELKCPSGEEETAGVEVADALVTELHARAAASVTTPPILVSSFTVAAIERVRALDAHVDTALLTFAIDDPAATVAQAAAAGHRALHPFDATVDPGLVRLAHDAGLAVNVWTVDDPRRMVELASIGVDGICTDLPDVAVRALADWRRAQRRGARNAAGVRGSRGR
jgi:glycerophosphoryl diester phosphodiesterase